jgi:hypothetical protein
MKPLVKLLYANTFLCLTPREYLWISLFQEEETINTKAMREKVQCSWKKVMRIKGDDFGEVFRGSTFAETMGHCKQFEFYSIFNVNLQEVVEQ